MPCYAYVEVGNLICPKCFRSLAVKQVGFQWGYCRSRCPKGPDYKIGDAMMWRLDRSGTAPAWTYFKGDGGNIGDPRYKNLVVRESELDLRSCLMCGSQLAGIAINISSGRITSVRVHETGLPDADISIANPDGTLTPMPEWDNHPMPVISGGPKRVWRVSETA